jgi:hypothetical protein
MVARAADSPVRSRTNEVSETHEELDEEGGGVTLCVVLDCSYNVAGQSSV